MRSESGIRWTSELRNLETMIFKPKKERRIDDIKMAWAVYLKSLERPSWWRRLWRAKNG